MSNIPEKISTTALQKLIYDQYSDKRAGIEALPIEPDVEQDCRLMEQIIGWIDTTHLELTDKELRIFNDLVQELWWTTRSLIRE